MDINGASHWWVSIRKQQSPWPLRTVPSRRWAVALKLGNRTTVAGRRSLQCRHQAAAGGCQLANIPKPSARWTLIP